MGTDKQMKISIQSKKVKLLTTFMIDLSHAIQSFSMLIHIDNCDADEQPSTVSRQSNKLGVILQSLSELKNYRYVI